MLDKMLDNVDVSKVWAEGHKEPIEGPNTILITKEAQEEMKIRLAELEKKSEEIKKQLRGETVVSEPKFNKKEYQRAYMAKRRA